MLVLVNLYVSKYSGKALFTSCSQETILFIERNYFTQYNIDTSFKIERNFKQCLYKKNINIWKYDLDKSFLNFDSSFFKALCIAGIANFMYLSMFIVCAYLNIFQSSVFLIQAVFSNRKWFLNLSNLLKHCLANLSYSLSLLSCKIIQFKSFFVINILVL